MLFFLLSSHTAGADGIKAVTPDYPGPGVPFMNRNDFLAFSGAERIAAAVNALPAVKLAGDTYIATDAGPHCSPRYDVIRAPKVGDKISYSFNGDTYPDGEIVNISASRRIVTSSTGKKYWRYRASGSWLNDGMWSMVGGHITEWNPHF